MHDIVTGTVVKKEYDNTIDKHVKGKSVENNDVDLEKDDLAKSGLHDSQPARRSRRHCKPVVRFNYKGWDVISQ